MGRHELSLEERWRCATRFCAQLRRWSICRVLQSKTIAPCTVRGCASATFIWSRVWRYASCAERRAPTALCRPIAKDHPHPFVKSIVSYRWNRTSCRSSI